MKIITQINKFTNRYWLLNVLQMIERLAYWVAILQIPIYIAQKDVSGGLHFEQTTKGIIFFWWALVQNLSPVFFGGVSDRIGKRKSMIISSLFVIIGYLLLATQRQFLPFLGGTLILGFGLGTFKPALQGWIAEELQSENSSVGWGVYVFLINFAVFFGPPIALYLKGISWQSVFYGSAIIFSANLIILLLIKNDTRSQTNDSGVLQLLIRTLFTKRIGLFVLIMSGFTMTYMQFYETLPNYIYDWSDTTQIASLLPLWMTSETPRGTQIAYEWLYNLNSGLIIMFVIVATKLSSRIKITHTLAVSILLAGLGLFLAGYSQSGLWLILGIVCYSFGEMITSPKFAEYIALQAPPNNKSLYMGLMNISWAIGLSGGGLLGGWIYKHYGEKSYIALKYLEAKGIHSVAPRDAFEFASNLAHKTPSEMTTYFFQTSHPNVIWLPFLLLSVWSVIGMLYYSKKY